MGDLSEHFGSAELGCPHCGRIRILGELIDALEELRRIAGLAIIVHSGYRCETHNREVGGKPGSEHLHGEAADISIPPLSLQAQYELALKVPAFKNGGIGVYDSKFLHVDVRKRQARWARVRGKYIGLENSGLVRV